MTDTDYKPIYTPTQRARLARLSSAAGWVFADVLTAMRNAEELEGPEGVDYVRLMEAIMEEATERRDYCRDHVMD